MKHKSEPHIHKYDKQGKMTCCDLEDKIYKSANASDLLPQAHQEKDSHHNIDNHDHVHIISGELSQYTWPLVSLILLITGIVLEHKNFEFFKGWVVFFWFLIAYIPVAFPVIKDMFKAIAKGEIFSEFFLMVIATIGAMVIGEYPEAVAVMLFYTIGEIFQSKAVHKAKRDIKQLIDHRPKEVQVLQNDNIITRPATQVLPNSIIELKPGEQLALDGILITESATLNTASLTGESLPRNYTKGQEILAGMINLNKVVQIKTTKKFQDTKLAHILYLIKEANSRKAPTELFIRKFAKVYTPIVVFLATAICFLPYFFVENYILREWLYMALVFLVISCPCALVISIPLGYFGGIGAASRNGVLFKGGNFLDVMAQVRHVIMDKTGTLTRGNLQVTKINIYENVAPEDLLSAVYHIEKKSTHPIALAICKRLKSYEKEIDVTQVEELPGLGMSAFFNGKPILIGRPQMLRSRNIYYDDLIEDFPQTTIAISYDNVFVGFFLISDQIKTTSQQAISELHQMGIKTTMLSGDKNRVVREVARTLSINNAFGGLLPQDKVKITEQIKAVDKIVAFVGDGVNDAPVVAISDAGIAMGGLGSDAVIESADVVIQDDDPLKIPMSIKIGKATKKIVWQNISMAFIVKVLVLILGAGGLATMWEAVFADVGVALIAIFNAMRIQNMNFK